MNRKHDLQLVARSYPAAEDLADDLASRCGGRWAVAEDFETDQLVVLTESSARSLVEAKDAELKYVGGPTREGA